MQIPSSQYAAIVSKGYLFNRRHIKKAFPQPTNADHVQLSSKRLIAEQTLADILKVQHFPSKTPHLYATIKQIGICGI
jgi:hypothetical protein